MKKVLLLFATLFTLVQSVFAYYNHSIITSSGQTLYFMVYSNFDHSGYALVTPPGAPEYPYFAPSGSGHNYNYTRPTGDLVIPDSVTVLGYTYPVTGIDTKAFYGCTDLTSVILPDGVDSIGDNAFSYCSGLTSITIPSSVTSIGSSAFGSCDMTSVNYTGTVAQWCNIDFSDAYSNPTGWAQTLNINGSPVSNLVIPDGVSTIKQFAFYGYWGLASVTIPNSVTSIGIGAFGWCLDLTSVTIGNGVTTIGDGAFGFCGLTSMTCIATVPPEVEDTSTFYGVDYNIPLYVPTSSVSSYQVAFVWSEFTNYIGIGPHTITVTSANPTMGTVTGGGTYNGGTTATLTATPNTGYHFVQWQDGNTQNPRTITVTGDATYTATFAPDAAPATATATISQVSATSAHLDIVMGENTLYYIYLCGPQSLFVQYGVTTNEEILDFVNQNYGPSDRNYNNVSGYINDLTANTTYWVVVVPYNNDGVAGSICRKQFTTPNTSGIEGVGEERYIVSSQDGHITVSGAEGEYVYVYSIDGCCVYSASATETTVIDVPSSGAYFVKVGNTPARKVVVIR